MAHDEYLFTSESVTEGHPDKIADQISDAVLDAISRRIRAAASPARSLLTTGLIVVAGEITTTANVDIAEVARQTVKDVGYTRAKFGFDCRDLRRGRRPSTSSRRTSPRESTRAATSWRGRPGSHVRLRVQRDRRS